jgi:hypothetical protein
VAGKGTSDRDHARVRKLGGWMNTCTSLSTRGTKSIDQLGRDFAEGEISTVSKSGRLMSIFQGLEARTWILGHAAKEFKRAGPGVRL